MISVEEVEESKEVEDKAEEIAEGETLLEVDTADEEVGIFDEIEFELEVPLLVGFGRIADNKESIKAA